MCEHEYDISMNFVRLKARKGAALQPKVPVDDHDSRIL